MEGYSNHSGLEDLNEGEMADGSNRFPPKSYSCRFHDCLRSFECRDGGGEHTVDHGCVNQLYRAVQL